MTTPNIDTKALRELEAKATPGPWSSSYYGDGQFVVNIPRERSLCFHPRPPSGSDDQSATVYGAPGVAKILPGDVVVGMSGWELDGLTEQEYANQRVADGQLIVALRNAAPALMDLADRAQDLEGCHRLNETCPPHLCCADHPPIRHWQSTDPEELSCPVCAEANAKENVEAERDALKAEVAWRQGAHDTLFKTASEIQAERNDLRSKLSASEREVERLREALTPSGETKFAYMNEFKFNVVREGPDHSEFVERLAVPWTTIKDIMHAISKRAALRGEEAPRE